MPTFQRLCDFLSLESCHQLRQHVKTTVAMIWGWFNRKNLRHTNYKCSHVLLLHTSFGHGVTTPKLASTHTNFHGKLPSMFRLGVASGYVAIRVGRGQNGWNALNLLPLFWWEDSLSFHAACCWSWQHSLQQNVYHSIASKTNRHLL